MSNIFVSYSRNRDQRRLLVEALRDHGLTPWRDFESIPTGAPTTETIEAELAACSAVILWIDHAFLESDYVRLVELPAIERGHRLRGLRIMPVFDGLSPAEAGTLLNARVRARQQQRSCRRHRVRPGGAEMALRPALQASAAAMKQAYGATDVQLAIKAHLPRAVAVGHAFAEPTGCRLVMRRGTDVFDTSRGREPVPLLQQTDGMLGPVTTMSSAVEVSGSRNIQAGVTHLMAGGTRYRYRVMLAPPGGTARGAVAGPSTASTWARQIAEAVIAAGDRVGVDRVDVFLATTVELAVMVGWWMNAAGTINVMNWRGQVGPYERIWTLP